MDTRVQEERLKDWYRAMKNGNKEEAAQQKEALEAESNQWANPECHQLFQLLTARFHLMHKDLDQAAAILAKAAPTEEVKNGRLHYFYHFFHGIYDYERKDYAKAIDHYLKAEPILKTKDSPEELAEFSYKLASAYYHTYHAVLSIEYAEQALRIFRSLSHYVRMSHCENVIALNYQDIKHYKETERHLRNSLLCAARVRDERVKKTILNNFGYFYSIQNQPKTALVYLTQAYQLMPPENTFFRVQNLFLSALNYFKMNQRAKACSVLHDALTLARDHGHEEYDYHCEMLKAKYVEPSGFEESYKTGIAYFEDHDMLDYVMEYSEELADFYQKDDRYQEACTYYAVAVKARNKIDRAQSSYR